MESPSPEPVVASEEGLEDAPLPGEEASPTPVTPDAYFTDVAQRLAVGETVGAITLRHLLSRFGRQRRGTVVNRKIEEALAQHAVSTAPPFREAWIDDGLTFRLVDAPEASHVTPASVEDEPAPDYGRFTVRRFVSDEKRASELVSVAPTTSLAEAVTKMLLHDFSQLPVMSNPKSVQGFVTWRSIGKALALGHTPKKVDDCMEGAHDRVVRLDDPFRKLVITVRTHDMALVQDRTTREHIALFTAADLGDMFEDLTHEFLLLEEIEIRLRALLERGHFAEDELNACLHPESTSTFKKLADLDFGSYVVLLGDAARWERLRLGLDRSLFVSELDKVRELRNAVMHFDPDGLDPVDTQILEQFCRLLRELENLPPPPSATQ